ncbi:MAG: YraN family protein [Candidatus Doudnabacteria bacterium]
MKKTNDYNQTLGQLGEDLAVKVYQRQYYTIIARNTYNHHGKRLGELDFVALKDDHIYFVEVKIRTTTKFGLPHEAVTKYKQIRLIRAVYWFLNRNPKYREFVPQIDVCAINLTSQKSSQDKEESPNVQNAGFSKAEFLQIFNSGQIDKLYKCVTIYANAVETKL